jgi:hypothetical protein
MKFKFLRTHFNKKRPNQILILLLSLDFLFILTHALLIYIVFIRVQFDWSIVDMFLVNYDNGYPEMFQYLKFFAIAVIFIYFVIKKKGIGFISWCLLFILLLLDDSLQFHERFGEWVVEKFNYSPMFGLRAQDLGELTFVTFFGSILLFFLVFGYLKGNEKYRKTNIDLGLLFIILLFFGVAVDMMDQLIEYNRYSYLFLVLLEDGGEMISTSFIVWYLSFLIIKPKDYNWYLFQYFYKNKTTNKSS